MKMLADQILIRPLNWVADKVGAIILPDSAEIRQCWGRGVVMAVGPGLWVANATQIPIEPAICEGAIVLYFKAKAIPLESDKRDVHIVTERAIVAVFEEHEVKDVRKMLVEEPKKPVGRLGIVSDLEPERLVAPGDGLSPV